MLKGYQISNAIPLKCHQYMIRNMLYITDYYYYYDRMECIRGRLCKRNMSIF